MKKIIQNYVLMHHIFELRFRGNYESKITVIHELNQDRRNYHKLHYHIVVLKDLSTHVYSE